ncbi:MAG: hypothetical protein IKG47_04390 [Oscillospiraceae bacterium]|nr:hypothetical protein [Oscillospiraceae bacterium]
MKMSTWKKNLRKMLDDPSGYSGDSDHPECPICGSTMNFHGEAEGFTILGEGFWECPDCGKKITENEFWG